MKVICEKDGLDGCVDGVFGGGKMRSEWVVLGVVNWGGVLCYFGVNFRDSM